VVESGAATVAYLDRERVRSMNRCVRAISIAVFAFVALPTDALAGMPSITLSDLARMRISTISFFLVVFLVSSWFVRWLWNSVRKDCPRLPYLTYRRAITLVALWGLLFLLVLTMISGARELMTPGAWKKEGFTYKLKVNEAPAKAQAIERETQRRAALDRLRAALWTYANHHGGHFPPDDRAPEIPGEAWRVPDASAMRFIYTAGLRAGQGDSPLVYEPGIFGNDRLVLLSSGKIVSMTDAEPSSATGKAP
jgi:hypothetical protein